MAAAASREVGRSEGESVYRAMVVTDLDGTLFQRQHRVSQANVRTLHRLGERGILRVIATGRNLYSARKVLDPGFPVDFLIFSTGAGVMDWRAQRLIRSVSMRPRGLRRAFHLLRRLRADFMVHRPVPVNHYFVYFYSGRENPDFHARLGIYREFATPGQDGMLPMRRASQLLAVEPVRASAGPTPPGAPAGEPSPADALPCDGPSATGEPAPEWDPVRPAGPPPCPLFELLRRNLRGLNVVRTTSPLDGRSRWIEVFPPQVLKSLAAAWLAERLRIDRGAVLALGNDFNDLDLLEWAPHGYLVGGAAPELLERFPQVCTGGEEDFSAAVDRWEREVLGPGWGFGYSGAPAAGS
ncbi:MAG: HAD hydrolase family protein [Spirochaetales bacterium]|nr:HAD hydrolase family protein [Spirochaetales bacterium]